MIDLEQQQKPKTELDITLQLLSEQKRQFNSLTELQNQGYGSDPLPSAVVSIDLGSNNVLVESKLQFDSTFSPPNIILKIGHNTLISSKEIVNVKNVLSVIPEINFEELHEAIKQGEDYVLPGNIGEYIPGSPLRIKSRMSGEEDVFAKQLQAIDKVFQQEEGEEKPSRMLRQATETLVEENRNTLARIEEVKTFVDTAISYINSNTDTVNKDQAATVQKPEREFAEKASRDSHSNRDRSIKRDLCDLYQMAKSGNSFNIDIFGDNSVVVSSDDLKSEEFWKERFGQIQETMRDRIILIRNTTNFEAVQVAKGEGGKPLTKNDSEAAMFYKDYLSDPNTTDPRLSHWSLGLRGHSLYESGSSSAANSEASLSMDLSSEPASLRAVFFESDTGNPDYNGGSYQEGLGGMNNQDVVSVFAIRHMRLLTYAAINNEPDYKATFGSGYIEAQVLGKLDEKTDNISISLK